MRSAAILAAVAFAACAVRPAPAADLAQLDCPLTRLSDRDRAALVEALTGVEQRADTRFEAFGARVDECARSHGWSPAAAAQARLYNLAFAGNADTRRRLETAGVDVAAIERAVLADTALIAAAGSGQYPEAQINDFIARLRPSAEEIIARQPAGSDVGTRLGMFIMFRTIMESARAGFAAN